jgi:hypothetical protein
MVPSFAIDAPEMLLALGSSYAYFKFKVGATLVKSWGVAIHAAFWAVILAVLILGNWLLLANAAIWVLVITALRAV